MENYRFMQDRLEQELQGLDHLVNFNDFPMFERQGPTQVTLTTESRTSGWTIYEYNSSRDTPQQILDCREREYIEMGRVVTTGYFNSFEKFCSLFWEIFP